MTRQEFRELVLELIKPHGAPYSDEIAEQNRVINRRLRMYSARTLCLYDDAITFTLTQDVALYTLTGSAFSKDIFLPEAVLIDGSWLTNYDGEYGPCTIEDLRENAFGYLTADSAKPSRWALMPNGVMRLFAAPDQAYSNCYVQGYTLHPELSVDNDDDEATELSIPEPYVFVSAAWFAALGFLGVNQSTGSDLEIMRGFSITAAEEMGELIKQSQRLMSGSGRRHGGVGARTLA